jgi:hypothetical protein
MIVVSENCFRTTDIWLDIVKNFAELKSIMLSDPEGESQNNIIGEIGLCASYGYSKGIVSKEELDTTNYHLDNIRKALKGVNAKLGVSKASESAITWAGRTFADKVAICECGGK